jgi:phosphate starvation-inducible protein PhoH
MNNIKFDDDTKKQLIEIASNNQIYLEGNIVKLIDSDGNKEFANYLNVSSENDKNNRRKRLEVTKQIQLQNKQLIEAQQENEKLMSDLKVALERTKNAKELVEQDLDILQKKTQTELIGTIVKIALWVIIGVGLITSGLYMTVLIMGGDSKIIESTWSNLFGILLTNSFSIIGTIMGVKYATENKN